MINTTDNKIVLIPATDFAERKCAIAQALTSKYIADPLRTDLSLYTLMRWSAKYLRAQLTLDALNIYRFDREFAVIYHDCNLMDIIRDCENGNGNHQYYLSFRAARDQFGFTPVVLITRCEGGYHE